ncbi:Protein RRP5-like protein [Verticillium dahliae VDG1]|nr:Protein RRP5-like protein [Verticillium dahliae VDG1]
MKFSLAVLALAGVVAAGDYPAPDLPVYEPPKDHYPAPSAPPVYEPPAESHPAYEPPKESYPPVEPPKESHPTITEHGTTYYNTYTTTDTVVTKVYTTLYETVKKPDVTHVEKATDYITKTIEKPVTETKYIDGHTTVITHIETQVVTEHVPVTKVHEVPGPDVTSIDKEVEYQTKTIEVPVYQTSVIDGQTVVQTHYKTEVITTHVPVTHIKTVQKPDVTKTAEAVIYTTIQGEQAVTVTHYEEGETIHIQPTEVVYPEPSTFTEIVVPPPETVSEPAVTVPATTAPETVPTAAAQANQAPVIAMVAGIVGAIALL